MIVAQVSHNNADNMNYNVAVAKNRTHIVVEATHKIVKFVINMAHNASHNCKFD